MYRPATVYFICIVCLDSRVGYSMFGVSWSVQRLFDVVRHQSPLYPSLTIKTNQSINIRLMRGMSKRRPTHLTYN